jgi:hypothetical protein
MDKYTRAYVRRIRYALGQATDEALACYRVDEERPLFDIEAEIQD